MSGDAHEAAATRAFNAPLACACVALWIIAAASSGALGIWLAIGGAAVVLGTAVVLLELPTAALLLQPSPRLVLAGAAAGCAMAAATYLLYPISTRILPFIASDTALLYAAFRAPSPTVAAIALGPIILGEELVWRGAVQATLVRRLGPRTGVALAAAAYALAHAPLGSPVLVAVALLCGIVWGTLRATTASLVPPLLAHLVWDVLVLLWLPLDAG